MVEIFIKGNFPSFKNSKQYFGKGRVIMSKTVLKYLKEFEYQWKVIPEEFLLSDNGLPIKVGFHFVRGTLHRWDFHNMVQGCADLMVKHKWIYDDSVNYFLPFPLEINDRYCSYSKEAPGVFIKIL